MSARRWKCAFAAAVIVASSSAWAQRAQKQDFDNSSKESMHQQLVELDQQIDAAKANGQLRQLDALMAKRDAISRELGGDAAQPQSTGLSAAPAVLLNGPQMLVGPSCGATVTTTNFVGSGAGTAFSGGSLPLTTVETVSVSGLGNYIWDVNFNLNLPHTFASDLDITLTSPAGTVVTITTDNGGSNDNVYTGTLFDDSTLPNTSAVTDFVYTNLVVATPLASEGRLQAFRGEDPNGTWTLRVVDDAGGDNGTLTSWSVDITTLAGAPTETTASFSDTTGYLIPPGAPGTTLGTTVATQTVTTADTYLSELSVYVEITHTSCADIDMTLTSPAGTTVTLTTDNAGTFDNCFNGTLFDVDAPLTVTDAVYANLVVQPLLAPEGGFDAFTGQDPNGTWTLTIVDDATTNVGNLARWDLNVTTASSAPSPSAPSNFGQASGAVITNGTVPLPPLTVTAAVSGMGTYLWDLDLTTAISHTSAGDLDMFLTSPAGTTVTISTDNGGTFDDVYNGTIWDDNVNDLSTDRTYTNLTLATPLSPEGRLSAFRGQDPNGTWTLTIFDDATADNGTLNSWSIDVSTLTAAPTTSSGTFSNTTPVPIPTGAPTTTSGPASDTMTVSGLGTAISKVTLFTAITHTFPGDLDITLTSPTGTIVTVSTDNGGTNDNCYNGTSWDPASTIASTDAVYAINVVVPLVSPEGAFDNFLGQDPNGVWTLSIVDDAGGDFGSLDRWDLTIETCGSGSSVFTYCTAGVSTNGCSALMSASAGTASISAGPGSFTLTASGVEGQKLGLVFYGINGQASATWGSSSSFLCVKAPTQRLPSTNTNGTAGLCDGSLSMDFFGYMSTHPFTLGQPITAGQVYNAQAWYRDPPSPKTTHLSNGIEFTLAP